MSWHPLITTPCVVRVQTPGAPDEYGDATSSYVETSTRCELQQQTANELRDGQLTAVTEWRAFLPHDAPLLRAQDELETGGRTYAAHGDAWAVRDPLSGVTSHLEARLRRAV